MSLYFIKIIGLRLEINIYPRLISNNLKRINKDIIYNRAFKILKITIKKHCPQNYQSKNNITLRIQKNKKNN